jgi:membrane fusion protein, multidrug efflux system
MERQAMVIPNSSLLIRNSIASNRMTEMNGRYGWAVVGVVSLAVTAACAGGAAEASTSEEAGVAGRVITVEVETIRTTEFTDFLRIVGTVAANRDVLVAAEEGGVVRQLFVEKGAVVQAGQPLAKIDDAVLRPQVDQAVANARLAAETWERQQRLWEVEKIGSEMAYLQAKYNAQTAEAGARAMQERLAKTIVRAPISGVLDDRLVEVGGMVAPGTPIARVVDAATVKITGGVPERYTADITRGASMRVSFDGLGGVEHLGKVEFVGATLNETNRTFPVEVSVPNPQGFIRPGMVANLQVARRAVDQALLVPQSAVLRRETGYVAFVAVEKDGRTMAELREVVPAGSEAGRVVIEHGLQAGDRLIVVGQQQVSNGDRLRIVE